MNDGPLRVKLKQKACVRTGLPVIDRSLTWSCCFGLGTSFHYFKLIGGLKIVSSVRLSVSSQFWKKWLQPKCQIQGFKAVNQCVTSSRLGSLHKYSLWWYTTSLWNCRVQRGVDICRQYFLGGAPPLFNGRGNAA